MSRSVTPRDSKDPNLMALWKHWPAAVTMLTVAGIGSFLAVSYDNQGRRAAKSEVNLITPSVQLLGGVPALDKASLEFNIQALATTRSDECFPIHMSEKHKVGILYLYCSPEAWAADAQPRKLTENFEVTERLARRFNFWRRVYSLWTKDNYVLHVSRWPEIVFEIYDGARLGDHIGPVGRETQIKKVAKDQRADYKALLVEMHKHRQTPERFTPAMQRIASQMEHIEANDKYLVASYSLRLQRGQRDFIATGLSTAGKYLPAIEREFNDIGVPVELSRIAFVESSFNLLAKSKVGASGVYQIMPATGKQYLKLHSGIDERNDPIKASRAAAKLFQLNYRLLGKWPLAVTAYNHGVGGVRKAVRRSSSDNLEDLIDHYTSKSFRFASKNFYASYLAVMATIQDAHRVFPEIPAMEPLNFEEHRLPVATSLSTIRRKFGVTNAEIQEYNPDITRPIITSGGTLPTGYRIKIPARADQAATDTVQPPRS